MQKQLDLTVESLLAIFKGKDHGHIHGAKKNFSHEHFILIKSLFFLFQNPILCCFSLLLLVALFSKTRESFSLKDQCVLFCTLW